MKAAVITKQGSADNIKIVELPKPSPKPNEILIKVKASTVTAGDSIMRKANPAIALVLKLMGVKQSIPGIELAGVIKEVGENVVEFSVGDEVFGTTTGLKYGANAEYVCLPVKRKMGVLVKKPKNLTFEQAAALPVGGMTALYLLIKVKIKEGDKVLILGASGSVGSFAVQLAKYYGAKVTAVCSAENAALAKSLGADYVIDYKETDIYKNNTMYHLIFDAVNKYSALKLKKLLFKGGKFVTVMSLTKEKTDSLEKLKELADNGAITPVIDKTYRLTEVADAHKYVETWRKKGNVVIRNQS